MPVPWVRLLELVLGVADWRRGRAGGRPAVARVTGSRSLLDARIAGVIAAALGDVFARDRRREAIEQERLEAERREAERLRQLFLMREIGDREIGRLRLVAGLGVAGWIGSLVVTVWLPGAEPYARALVGAGWVLLLLGLVLALHAQAALADALARLEDPDTPQPTGGFSGAAAPWLVVTGLVALALAVFL